MAFDSAVKRAQVVVQVEVVQHLAVNRADLPRPTQMKARVLKTYWGQVNGTPISILGDQGMDPYPFITQFPVGTRWIMALTRLDWRTNRPLPGNVYAPLGCAQQGLLVSGPIAYGSLSGGMERISAASSIRLTDLPAWIKSVRARP